jgi:environmental stress-induced protein Ves
MVSELIAADNFKRMPWKNGKGVTTELIARSDPLSNKLLWRLSIATVTVDGEFSDFSGFQRTLMMISGNGIALSHQAQTTQTLTRQYQHCSFDGGWKTSAKLIDGPITDFNVICDSQRVSANVSALKQGESKNIESDASEIFFLAYKEASNVSLFSLNKPKQLELPKGYLLHLSSADRSRMTVRGDGLICVEIVNF